MLATDPLALSVWWSKTAVDTLSTLQIPTKCATHNIYITHFSFVFRPKSHIQSDKSYRKLLSKYGISYVFVHQVFYVVGIVCYTQKLSSHNRSESCFLLSDAICIHT